MPKATPSKHAEILEYALSHLERDRDAIQAKIDHIRLELGLTVKAAVRVKIAAAAAEDSTEAPDVPAAAAGKRVLSEAARKRIAAAQKRRWAEHRKNKKPE